MNKPSPTLTVPIDSLNDGAFLKSFEPFQNGLYLVDCNQDVWIRIDTDGIHNTYVRDTRKFGDSN